MMFISGVTFMLLFMCIAHDGKITGLEYCHSNEHCFWTTSSDTALRCGINVIFY